MFINFLVIYPGILFFGMNFCSTFLIFLDNIENMPAIQKIINVNIIHKACELVKKIKTPPSEITNKHISVKNLSTKDNAIPSPINIPYFFKK